MTSWLSLSMLAVLLPLGAAAGTPPVPAPIGPLPEPLPYQAGVRDPVFAVLVGLLRGGHFGTLTREQLAREIGRRGVTSNLPYQLIREVSRLPETGGMAEVKLVFETGVDVPVPYRILFYHPGSVLAAKECILREWDLGDIEVPLQEAVPGAPRISATGVHLLALEQGRLFVDIDAWVDRLLGSSLDDTEFTGLAVFRLRGHELALAIGYNRARQPRSGAFDFESDKVLFPYPEEPKAVARYLRRQLEARAPRPAVAAHGDSVGRGGPARARAPRGAAESATIDR